MNIILLLLLIVVGLIALILFILSSNAFKDGWSSNKKQKNIKSHIEFQLKDKNIYDINQVLDIEKVVRSGIYIIYIQNPKNENDMFYYIGQAKDLRSRLMEHRRNIINRNTSAFYGKLLDWVNERGIVDYLNLTRFSILELCDVSQLSERESAYIERYNALYNGGNTMKATRRPDDQLREEENISLIENLKEATIAKVYINVELTTAQIPKGGLAFRKSDSKSVVKFKKGDFAFTSGEIGDTNLLGIDDEYDIIYNQQKIDIHNIPKETLNALIEISKEQDK